jgi:hypothetical protein
MPRKMKYWKLGKLMDLLGLREFLDLLAKPVPPQTSHKRNRR